MYEYMEKEKAPESSRRLAIVTLGAGGFGSWPVAATPGIPADRVKILRDAYVKTLQEPDLLDEAKKRGWEMRPVTGEDMASLAKEVTVAPAGCHRADEKIDGRMRHARGASFRERDMNWRILNWFIAIFCLATVSLADARQAKKVARIG